MSNHASSHSQPAPTGSGRMVGLAVVQDVLTRMDEGDRKYHTPLRTENGRDPLVDAYQEAHDLVMYLKQAILERQNSDQKMLEGHVFSTRQMHLIEYALGYLLSKAAAPGDPAYRNPSNSALVKQSLVTPLDEIATLFDAVTSIVER